MKEMARTMLDESKLSNRYWKEDVHIVVYTLNRAQLRVKIKHTPYELWYGYPSLVKHFKIFGNKCFIKNSKDNIGSFDSHCDEGIFLGYSSHSKAYKCFNKRLNKIMENIHVKVNEVVQDMKVNVENTLSQKSKDEEEK